MLRSFGEKFFNEFVKKRGKLVLTREEQEEVLSMAKRVRACDYVVNFEIKNGVVNGKGVVTRANWLFLLTNAACYWNMVVSDFPKVAIEFPNLAPQSPFNTVPQDFGCVPSNLVFGREALTGKMQHFEEYKNLYYVLHQRFPINLYVKSAPGIYGRGSVILSGLDIDLNEV